MFCKPPHPVYIVLFRGDDTDFVGNQEIIVKITTERDISRCKAYFKYMGNIQTFDAIPEDKELHLVFSSEQTKEMPLGTWDAELYLIDENGKRMTVNNRIHMLVTNSVREAYFPDDPQSVSVVISANKYIEDAEVSADGKTLTLTKKDGTEVSFHGGGGGGGTNDYNDLENKPSINGATLTGNVNLATPEQLSLKADKANVYTKTEVDEKVDAVDNKADAAYSAAESLADGVNSLAGTIGTHIRNTKNPHKVTAAQVGAYTTGEIDEKLAVKADEFTPWMFAGETDGYDNLSVVIESVYEGAAFDYKLYSGGTFIAGFTDSSDSLTVAYFLTIEATKRITATRKRILYTGGSVSIGESTGGGGTIEVTGSGASIKKDGKEVATEEYVDDKVSVVSDTLTNLAVTVNDKADKATTLAGYGITDAATKTELNAKADKSALAAKADKSTTLAGYGITDAATKTELNAKADKSALAAKADKSTTLAGYGITDGATKTELAELTAKVEYPLYAVPSTGILKDRAINTTSLASVTVPDNFTDLLIRASVASSLSVTMPEAITTKYGDTFPGEAGEYLITITKTGTAEAYVRTIKLEVANA